MKEKVSIKTLHTLVPLIGLAFLLLISPCKVRHSIQAELGVPLTEVANKSKATISNHNCNYNETSIDTLTTASSTRLFWNIAQIGSDFAIQQTENSDNTPKYSIRSVYPIGKVPLYILYQNPKDYL